MTLYMIACNGISNYRSLGRDFFAQRMWSFGLWLHDFDLPSTIGTGILGSKPSINARRAKVMPTRELAHMHLAFGRGSLTNEALAILSFLLFVLCLGGSGDITGVGFCLLVHGFVDQVTWGQLSPKSSLILVVYGIVSVTFLEPLSVTFLAPGTATSAATALKAVL